MSTDEMKPGTPVVAKRTLKTSAGTRVEKGDKGTVVKLQWMGDGGKEDYYSVVFLNKGICVAAYLSDIEVYKELAQEKTMMSLASDVKFGEVLMGDYKSKFLVQTISYPDLEHGETLRGTDRIVFGGMALEDVFEYRHHEVLDTCHSAIVRVYL